MADFCCVYWGSHGCNLERGHDGPHLCDCADDEGVDPKTREYVDEPGIFNVGAPPYYGPDTNFYGEDAPLRHKIRSVCKHWKVWGWRISWGVLRGRR
jgi:hypothetical protein